MKGVFGKAWENLRAIPRAIRDAFVDGDQAGFSFDKEDARRRRQIDRGIIQCDGHEIDGHFVAGQSERSVV